MNRKHIVFGAACTLGLLSSVQGQAQLKLTQVASGLSLPIAIIQDPAFPDTQYIVQQRGLVRVLQNGVLLPTNAINLTGIASTAGSERGLLGLTFHPNYPTQPYVYVNYTAQTAAHATHIVRYTRGIDPRTFDVATATPIIQIAQDFSNHNGGTVRFGPDGYLYIGMGDGGSANDPNNRAQNFTALLGKMLRLDVNGDAFPADPNKNYAFPPGQPFTITGGTLASETFLLGLRNPWKFSFDNPALLGTGALLIADVGQNTWEEVNYVPAGAGGRNMGWRPREGYASTGLSGGPNANYVDPIWVYDHSVGQSITGGYVYRGTRLGDFFGRYFFSDYVASKTWSMKLTINGVTGEASNVASGDVTEHTSILTPGFSGISSIDVDENGELYMINYGGGSVYRVDSANRFYIVEQGLRQGYPVEGSTRSLLSNDDKFYTIGSDFLEDTVLAEGAVLRVTHENDVMPTGLSVQVVAKSNQPTGVPVQIGLRNWTTGRVDRVGTLTNITLAESTITASAGVVNYVRNSDRRVEVYVLCNQGMVVDPTLVSIDQVKIN